MKRVHRTSIRLGMAISVVVAIALLASASALAGGGAGAVDRCGDGGWEALLRLDGQGFKNQGDCVSYAVAGGAFTRLEITTGPMLDFGGGTFGYQISASGEGLLPGTIILLWLSGPGVPGGGPVNQANVAAVGADGTFSAVEFYNLSCPSPEFGFGYSSGFVTGWTSQGVFIVSAPFTHPC